MMPSTRTPLIDRWMSKVDITAEGCWPWEGTIDSYGYGVISEGGHNGRKLKAHRVGYEMFEGPIPDGLVVDHLCNNRSCVNPDHMECVTPEVNVGRRGERMTACVNGHAYPENLYMWNGIRYCRTCRSERSRRWKTRR